MAITKIDGTILYADAADARAQLTPSIKAECEKRILAVMPQWRQRNTIADLTSDNADTKAAAVTDWAQVTALRNKSNEIEASILSMTNSQIIEFDASDDAHWD